MRAFVGAFVGAFAGTLLGAFVGTFVGAFVATLVGAFVGTPNHTVLILHPYSNDTHTPLILKGHNLKDTHTHMHTWSWPWSVPLWVTWLGPWLAMCWAAARTLQSSAVCVGVWDVTQQYEEE